MSGLKKQAMVLWILWLMNGCTASQQTVVLTSHTVTGDQTSSVTHKDTTQADTQTMGVQFLQLSDSDAGANHAPQLEQTAALEKIKEAYADALKKWYVEQNGDGAKDEYEKAVDALYALGEILAAKESFDETDMNGGTELPVKIDESRGEIEDLSFSSDSVTDYANWLAVGILENYKNVLEATNQYDEKVFNQQVLNKLSYFDVGLSGLNSYGKINAPIAKGHALDYIPMVSNERVQKYVDYLKGPGINTLQHLYFKLGRYEKLIYDALKSEGLSEDLIYLAMIESGFSTTAKSRARAVGPWQFMVPTGRYYGLNIDWWVDERKDIYASTKAAAKHLKDLFYEYGDWYLAMAAYNYGGVKRAIRKNNTRDYWEMTKLPKETKNYIPYILAATSVVKNQAQYGIQLSKDAPMLMDTVTISECLDLQIIAECAKTTVDSVRELNPALLRWCTPPTIPNYMLKLPYGTRATFLENYAKVPADKKRSWVRYQVKYGETLSGIANKYGTDIKAIMQANQLKNSANLTTGQYLLIPVAPSGYVANNGNNTKQEKTYTYTNNKSNQTNVKSNNTNSSAGNTKKKDDKQGKKKIVFTVKSGHTLGEIAEWYNILAQNIRDWNGLYYGDPIYPGQVLTLWVDPYVPDEGYRNATKKKAKETIVEEPGTKIYVVQDGDTLISIAKLFGVEVSSIKQWNKLASNTVRVGEKLKILVSPN